MPMGIHANLYEIIATIFLVYLLLFKFRELNIFFKKYIHPSYGQFLTGILFLLIGAIIIPLGATKISTINKVNDLYMNGISNNQIGGRFLDSVSEALKPYADKNKTYSVDLLPSNLGPDSQIQNDVHNAYTVNLAIKEQIRLISDGLSSELFGAQNLQLSGIELNKLFGVEFEFSILNKKAFENQHEHLMTVDEVLDNIKLKRESAAKFDRNDRLFFTKEIIPSLQKELYGQLSLLFLSICGGYLGLIMFLVWLRLSADDKIKWLKAFFIPFHLQDVSSKFIKKDNPLGSAKQEYEELK